MSSHWVSTTVWVRKTASYAYIVVPGKTSAQEMKAYQKNAIEILSNNPKIQAVRNTKLNVWMVTFFEAVLSNIKN